MSDVNFYMDDEPTVKVTLRDIYAQGQETRK